MLWDEATLGVRKWPNADAETRLNIRPLSEVERTWSAELGTTSRRASLHAGAPSCSVVAPWLLLHGRSQSVHLKAIEKCGTLRRQLPPPVSLTP